MLEGEEEEREDRGRRGGRRKRKKKGETIKESSLTIPTEDGSATLLSPHLYRYDRAQ